MLRLFRRQMSHEVPATLAKLREIKSKELVEKYPEIMPYHLKGRTVFTLQSLSPDEMMAQGGFRSSIDTPLWWNKYSGDNKGSICFTMLPEIACLFRERISREGKAYLYACTLFGRYFAPGGPWRQIISPGACPIEFGWAARELLEIKPDRTIVLGPLNKGNLDKVFAAERLNEFFRNHLVQPLEYDSVDGYPRSFHVIDTPESAKFQQLIAEHYAPKARPAL